MILALIHNAFLSLIGTAIPASTVVVLAATGAMLGERVGVLNLGQEGLIGIGAVYAVIAVQTWGVSSPWVALLIGMVAAGGGRHALRHRRRVLPRESGPRRARAGTGRDRTVQPARHEPQRHADNEPVPRGQPGRRSRRRRLLEAFLHHDPVVYIAYLFLPAVLWFVLFRTRHGMNMRAVGENPAAADAVGVSVVWSRLGYTILGAAISGAGGAYMVLSFTPTWSPDIARGRGWVALAVVIFVWKPGRVPSRVRSCTGR